MALWGMLSLRELDDERWDTVQPRRDIEDDFNMYNETKKAKERLARQEYLLYGLKREPKGYFRSQLFCGLKYPDNRPIDNFKF